MIQRFIESQLPRLATQFPVMTITGPRQSGGGKFRQYRRSHTQISCSGNEFSVIKRFYARKKSVYVWCIAFYYIFLIPCNSLVCGSRRHLMFNLCGRNTRFPAMEFIKSCTNSFCGSAKRRNSLRISAGAMGLSTQ